MKLVTELYEKHQRRSTHPSFEELQAIFMDISQYFSRIFLVIDGLDEMPDRWSILDFLENLSEIDGDFKVLVASRAEMDLENAFSFYCTITVTSDDITPDIERFVRAQFTKRRFRGTQVDEIVQELVARADGMYVFPHTFYPAADILSQGFFGSSAKWITLLVFEPGSPRQC